ncbi:MAG: hypothetical protein OEX22_07125, partial [Cyclobacteriaceae bacterium]|nr:hypothetical protein [Cyclobacteriaceae bacterium]
LGCDLNQITDFTKNLLTNGEVLAINQDELGIQAHTIYEDDCQSILMKEIIDGFVIGVFNRGTYCDTVIDMFNWGFTSPKKITVSWTDIGIQGNFMARNLWKQENIGIYSDQLTVEVNHHGVSLIKLTPHR